MHECVTKTEDLPGNGDKDSVEEVNSRKYEVVASVCALGVLFRVLIVLVKSQEATSLPRACLETGATVSLLTALVLLAGKEVVRAKKDIEERHLNASLFETLTYRMECWWGSKQYAIPLSLLYCIVLLNLLGGIVFSVATHTRLGESIFYAWMLLSTSDAGSGGDLGVATYTATLVSLSITICGLVIFGFLISIITEAVSEKVEHIKCGNSRIIEAGHTVILGQSPYLKSLICEIALANESEGGGVVAVLADAPLEQMQRELNSIPDEKLGQTKIVVRQGSSLEWDDLKLVSVTTARVTIVMANNAVSADESDAFSLRVALVLSGFDYMSGHVVSEIRDIDNKERIELISRHRTECVVAHDLVGRLMIQCARYPGLAQTYESLLGFAGDEVYIQEWPQLVGKTFLEVTRSFDFATPIGIKSAKNGVVVINPQPACDILVQPGDEIVVLAEDNDTYNVLTTESTEFLPILPKIMETFKEGKKQTSSGGPAALLRRKLKNIAASYVTARKQHILFLGWRRDIMDIVHFLDDVVVQGSTLTIMATLPVKDRISDMSENGRSLHLQNLVVEHVVGNHVSRRQLITLPLRRYSSILVLSEKSIETDSAAKDSLTCASVVLIDDILKSGDDDSFLSDSATSSKQVTLTSKKKGEPTPSVQSTVRGMPKESPSPSSAWQFSVDYSTLDISCNAFGMTQNGKEEAPVSPSASKNSQSALSWKLHEDEKKKDPGNCKGGTEIRLNNNGIEANKRGRLRLNRELSILNDPAVYTKKELPTIICELLDSRMHKQLEPFCEIVASNNYVSRVLAMVSEGADINSVLCQLLDAGAQSTLFLEPVTRYLNHLDEKIDFYQLALRVQDRENLLVGFYDAAQPLPIIQLNPKCKTYPRTFSPQDYLIVIGSDQAAKKRTH